LNADVVARAGPCTSVFTDRRDVAWQARLMLVPTLLVSGTVGAGKSTVVMEINDVLADLKIPNAALDLDALVWQWPSTSPWNNDLLFENLATLWPNYAAHGATHLVLARVLEDRNELPRYQLAVPGATITICRLVSPEALRLERLRARMPEGLSRDWHLKRSLELEAILSAVGGEDFTVENDERAVRDVSLDVLIRAKWMTVQQAEMLRPKESGGRWRTSAPHLR
jgi:hypothetical protein